MISSRSTSTTMTVLTSLLLLVVTTTIPTTTLAQDSCLADDALNAEFVSFIPGAASIPLEGSCCQSDVCGIPCPEPVSEPAIGMCRV